MVKYLLKKTLVIVLTILFITGAFLPLINGELSKINTQKTLIINQETSSLTFYTFDKTSSKECNARLSNDIVQEINDKLEKLKNQIVNDPLSEKTQVLKQDFVETLDTYGILPDGMTKDDVLSLLNPKWLDRFNKKTHPKFKEALLNTLKIGFSNPFFKTDKTNEASSTTWNILCNIASGGQGIPIPLFMLPRPRGIAIWLSSFAETYVGSLVLPISFVASGSQQGIALGFVGVGLTFSFGGLTGYIFIGYAVYTMIQAEDIYSFTPPNQKPEITNENPTDGAFDVPLSLSELSFKINDYENDPMDYTVTTNPYIGAGSGNKKKDGIYKIPVSGLVGNTKYTWKVSVNDDYSTVEKEYSFTTEAIAPIITNPSPSNDDTWVPIETNQLSFDLMDKQGDLMDYTVQTNPNIGTGSGTNVGDGTYYVDINNLDSTTEYTWYINATDGTHWTREIFNFKTQPIMVFDPFDEGWQYRKKITINHNQVKGDLTDFPVLINKVDSDLRDKAQSDGDDILFMDDSGIANRLFHEIELFDDSNGELVAWVKTSDISDSTDTILYMYYGNPTCDSQQYPDHVWDSGYCGVWHMDDLKDSTNNDNDGVNHGTDTTSGKIGNARDFVKNNSEYIDMGDMPEPADSNNNKATFEVWIKPRTLLTTAIINKMDNYIEPDKRSYNFGLTNTGKISAYAGSGTWYPSGDQIATLSNGMLVKIGSWQHVVATVDLSLHEMILYYNGQEIDSTLDIQGNPPTHFYDIDINEWIGAYRGEGSPPMYYDGQIDELRISKDFKENNWISTEYNNQNKPSSFYSIGPEESAP